ncbi:hypothetical protein GCM10027294_49680 [Marinactinospora endophytica]
MARGANGGRGPGAWTWSRTAETRSALLRGAREVFTEQGYSGAAIADLVERTGSSVGSVYHHFGGKAELFLALWEEHHHAQETRAATAVARAREAGVDDPLELFCAGARAFLEGSWERRDLSRLFMDGDGPPGFETTRRSSGRDWVRRNTVLLGAGGSPAERVTVAILTSVIGEAGREVAVCATRAEAEEVIETTLGLIRRLGAVEGGPAR